MATTTLKLSIEKEIAERIKKYAANQKTSVSSIAETLFSFIITESPENIEQEISPLVQSFSIDNVNIPFDFNYKKELTNARIEKYL